MKESIRTIGPQFSARRMVKEYTERMYLPAIQAMDQPEAVSEVDSASQPEE